MQKKKIIVISLITIMFIFISIILVNYNTDYSYIYENDGIKYAVTVDGIVQSSFPSKGLYRVDVICENATCNWLYDDWKLAIENIIGDVSCDIDFVTITKNNLNDYVISLAGTMQGAGQVISEEVNMLLYDISSISESFYTNQSIFSNTSASSTSGTSVNDIFSYANGKWTSDSSVMIKKTYYHFKFTPSASGYYQMCYDFSSGEDNRMYVYVNENVISFGEDDYLESLRKENRSGCIELGYVSNSDYIMVVQYNRNKEEDKSTLSFYVNKVETSNVKVNDVRYEGKNPNNYIWFNNELWRIIGVFDSSSHGQSNTNLVKIMRMDSIGGLAWDKSNTNNWSTASLNSLLNGAYYNAQDGTDSGYCFISDSVQGNCDYRTNGIQNGHRSMIQNVTWYLGGYLSGSATGEAFYGYERGITVYGENPTSTSGYIGLMYPSDYGYSVLSSSCARTTNLSSYSSSSCGGQSWIVGNGKEWMLSPNSLYSNSVFNLSLRSIFDFDNAYFGQSVRPVLYLKSDVYYIDGDGSILDPIIIGE